MEPLLIHHHIPKTAGSSLRRVLVENYTGEELVELYDRDPREWWRDHYTQLAPERRERIRCVGGHAAQLLIPLVDDRPVRAFCLLRDPVERVASLYDFMQSLVAHRARPSWRGAPQRWLSELLAERIRELDWTLADIYRELGGEGPRTSELHALFLPFFNGAARHLARASHEPPTYLPFVAEDCAELEAARTRVRGVLSSTYVAGTQDHFSRSVRLFADWFGWSRAFVPRVNTSRTRPERREVDAETRSLILAHNRLDAEVHAEHSRSVGQLAEADRLPGLPWHLRSQIRRLAERVRREGEERRRPGRALGGSSEPKAREHQAPTGRRRALRVSDRAGPTIGRLALSRAALHPRTAGVTALGSASRIER